MKDTKLAAKKQEVVDKINKKRFATKSKTKIIPPPIIENEKNDDEMKDAVGESNEDVDELVDTDNERDSNVDVDSEKSTSDQSNDESCGFDKNSKFNNEDDDDDEDPDNGSINRTCSDESNDEFRDNDNECNVILPADIMPVTIGTNTVNTQGVASSVNIHGKKYSNEMLLKKYCMLKRGSQKGVEIPYLINEVYINEHNNGYYYDVSSTNDLRKIVPDNKIRVTFDHWNLY